MVVRGLLKGANWLLFALGAAMALHAAFMFWQWQRDATAAPPPPAAHPPEGNATTGGEKQQQPDPNENHASHSLWSSVPWFIYGYGALGMHVVLTAIAGLIGAACDSKCCIGCHALLLVAMLIVQAALAAALVTMSSEHEPLPPDSTENEKQIWQRIRDNQTVAVCLGAALLTVELVDLVLSLVLQASSARRDDEDEDIDAYFERSYGADARRPLVTRQPQQHEAELGRASGNLRNAADSDSAWSERMRNKYGIDVSQYSYRPTRASASAPGTGDDATAASRRAQTLPSLQQQQQQQRGGCGVM